MAVSLEMVNIDTADRRRAGTAVLVAIVVTVLAWASSFVVIRGVAPYFTGGALALGPRYSSAPCSSACC